MSNRRYIIWPAFWCGVTIGLALGAGLWLTVETYLPHHQAMIVKAGHLYRGHAESQNGPDHGAIWLATGEMDRGMMICRCIVWEGKRGCFHTGPWSVEGGRYNDGPYIWFDKEIAP